MKPFKEYFAEKNPECGGKWGIVGEHLNVTQHRIADTIGGFMDDLAKEAIKVAAASRNRGLGQ